jgi:hypothetical protein
MVLVTLVAVFAYLFDAGGMTRHDTLCKALLGAFWCFYFLSPLLLRVRVLGPFLIGAGRLLLLAIFIGFFGGVYWVILSPHS